MSTITAGETAEAAVLGALVARGVRVWLPFGGTAPYDLIACLPDDRLVRMQVKSARLRAGCVVFNVCSTDHGRGRQDYRGRADVIAAWCPELRSVHVIAVAEATTRATALRVAPARNNQVARTRDATAHTLDRWLADELALREP